MPLPVGHDRSNSRRMSVTLPDSTGPEPSPVPALSIPPLKLPSHAAPSVASSGGGGSTVVSPKVAPQKRSFSVPPSSRAPATYSSSLIAGCGGASFAPDTAVAAQEALHARAANYETLLRQFKRRRSPTAQAQPPAQPPSPAAVAAARAAALHRKAHRLYRAGSAEDLRRSLTRLGSSFSIDRIHRRSTETSVHATSAATPIDGHGLGYGQGNSTSPTHRFSLRRRVRRLRTRVAMALLVLLQPMAPEGATMKVRQAAFALTLIVLLAFVPFAPAALAVYDRSGAVTDGSATNMVRVLARVNLTLELALLVEIALRFNTAFVVAKRCSGTPSATSSSSTSSSVLVVVTSRRAIAKRYVLGIGGGTSTASFPLDMLGVLPVETVCWLVGIASSSLYEPLSQRHRSLFHLANVLRVLQLRQLPSMLSGPSCPRTKGSPPSRLDWRHVLLELGLSVATSVHVLVCAWIGMLGGTEGDETQATDSLDMTKTYLRALIDVVLLLRGTTSTRFVELSSSQLSSVEAELLKLLVLIAGAVLSTIVLLRLAHVLLHRHTLDHTCHHPDNDDDAALQRHLTLLRRRMGQFDVPEALQLRVQHYVTHLWTAYGCSSSLSSSREVPSADPLASLTASLSAPLALELRICRYMPTLGRVPAWSKSGTRLLHALIARVECRVYLSGDALCRAGTPAVGEMLLLQRGRWDAPTEWLGQASLLFDSQVKTSVVALDAVEVGVVTRAAASDVLRAFPGERERVVRRIVRHALATDELPELALLIEQVKRNREGGGVAQASTISAREDAKMFVRMLQLRDRPFALPLSQGTDEETVASGSLALDMCGATEDSSSNPRVRVSTAQLHTTHMQLLRVVTELSALLTTNGSNEGDAKPKARSPVESHADALSLGNDDADPVPDTVIPDDAAIGTTTSTAEVEDQESRSSDPPPTSAPFEPNDRSPLTRMRSRSLCAPARSRLVAYEHDVVPELADDSGGAGVGPGSGAPSSSRRKRSRGGGDTRLGVASRPRRGSTPSRLTTAAIESLSASALRTNSSSSSTSSSGLLRSPPLSK